MLFFVWISRSREVGQEDDCFWNCAKKQKIALHLSKETKQQLCCVHSTSDRDTEWWPHSNIQPPTSCFLCIASCCTTGCWSLCPDNQGLSLVLDSIAFFPNLVLVSNSSLSFFFLQRSLSQLNQHHIDRWWKQRKPLFDHLTLTTTTRIYLSALQLTKIWSFYTFGLCSFFFFLSLLDNIFEAILFFWKRLKNRRPACPGCQNRPLDTGGVQDSQPVWCLAVRTIYCVNMGSTQTTLETWCTLSSSLFLLQPTRTTNWT